MGDKKDVWQGTLALMVLKTLQALGPLHGYASRAASSRPAAPAGVNIGTLYPLSSWSRRATSLRMGTSDNNRKPSITSYAAGRKQLEKKREWNRPLKFWPLPGRGKGIRMRSLRALLLRWAGCSQNQYDADLSSELEAISGCTSKRICVQE